MPDEDSFECGKCGRSFDSQRGLSIHQSQKHPDDEENDTEETNTGTAAEKIAPANQGISVSFQQAMVVVFALGLAIGFSGGLLVSGSSGLTANLDSDSADTNNDPSGSDSQISGESTMAAIKDIATSVDVDADQLESYVESSNGEEINQDRQEITQAVGQLGTPSFFIGNSEIGYTQISGAQPYSRMKPTIDRKLEQARNGNNTVGGDEYTLESISFEGEPTMGESSAPINIIEYSDYGCPWCAEWHGVDAIPQRPIDQEDSFNQVTSNYVETGDVQFVLKDYPVAQLHPNAETAHKAANYVLENSPENFWEFSQKLYQERDKW